MSMVVSDAPLDSYACHYCKRADGARTRDHKLPRFYGGAGDRKNILLCCKMCNMIKREREYGMFLRIFRELLVAHRDEYHAADPDDKQTIRGMQRKFDKWLREMQRGVLQVS